MLGEIKPKGPKGRKLDELIWAQPFDTIMGLIDADLGPGVYASAILWINSNTRLRTTL